MKTPVFLFLLVFFCLSNIQAQKVYTSTELKLIFSTAAQTQRDEATIKSPMRFSGFFNYAVIANIDFNNRFGISIGGEIKNIGLILKDSIFRTKHRAYAIGIPVYLRLGNLDKRWYVYAGGQYDYLFGYKEKVFVNDSKIKRTNGFGNDVNPFIPSVFLGFKAKSGISLSLNYMLNNFFSSEYRFKDPTKNDAPLTSGYTNSQIAYFSIGFMGDLDKSKTKTPTKTQTTEASIRRNY